MNREIRFRVWDNVDYMSLTFTLQDLQLRKVQFTEDCVVMQFTGFKDKNNKDIYEGDIITVEYGKGRVVFNAGCFMIEWIDDPEANMEWLGMYHKPHQLGRPRDDVEIIGNIYENNPSAHYLTGNKKRDGNFKLYIYSKFLNQKREQFTPLHLRGQVYVGRGGEDFERRG